MAIGSQNGGRTPSIKVHVTVFAYLRISDWQEADIPQWKPYVGRSRGFGEAGG